MDSYDSDSSVEHSALEESLLSKKKKQLVSISMAVFEQNLDQWLDNTLPDSGKSRGKRQRDGDDTSVDGHSVQGARAGVKAKRAKKGRKFACPFARHDPERYKEVKTCCGPGWLDFHRVREHVYRVHPLPKYMCDRCCKKFESDGELRAHRRAAKPCDLSKTDFPEGFNEKQNDALHERATGNEVQKWENMYRILFPGSSVPSPYYDSANDGGAEFDDKRRSEDIAAYKDYLRRELPRRAKPLIEQEVERLMKGVRDTMAVKAVEICQDIQNRLMRTWFYHKSEQTSLPSPAEDLGSTLTADLPYELPPIESFIDAPGFSSFLNHSEFDFETFMPPMPTVDCSTSMVTQDSAYWTSPDGNNAELIR